MRWALVLIGVFGAHAVQLSTESGVESEMEAFEKLEIEGVQDGQRVLVMVMKALDKFKTKVEAEQAEDTKQCDCRSAFMEGELKELCGTASGGGNNCPITTNMQNFQMGGKIKDAEDEVAAARLAFLTAQAAQKQHANTAAEYQTAMTTAIKQTEQQEATANARYEELMQQLKDHEILAQSLSDAIKAVISYGTGGINAVNKRLGPGMTPSFFLQLKQEVAEEKEKGNSAADELEQQLLAFEVAAGVGAQQKPKEEKKEALVQAAADPARLYLANDRYDMIIGYMRSMYNSINAKAKELQAGLEKWQDSDGASARDTANQFVESQMGVDSYNGQSASFPDATGMIGLRRQEITEANNVAHAQTKLQSYTAQLSQMRKYMRETQDNQVVETKACAARAAERSDELAALSEAYTELDSWANDKYSWAPAFIQTEMEAEESESASATTAWETLKTLRTNFETYRKQMQTALNTLTEDFSACKQTNQDADEEMTGTTLQFELLTAQADQGAAVVAAAAAAQTQLQERINDAEAKMTSASTKRNAQRERNREEAEHCEQSVAVTHKVIQVLSAHFQYGSPNGGEAYGLESSQYSETTQAAERTEDGDTVSPSDGIQHAERTPQMRAIIASLQKVAFEFEKCGQTMRATDRTEEGSFMRSQQDLMKLIQDMSIEKAYAMGTESQAIERNAQLNHDKTTAQNAYTAATNTVKAAPYANCKAAIAGFDADSAKLKQKIENAVAVKDLIMVAMQNLKPVPAYPQECTFVDTDSSGTVDNNDATSSCSGTTQSYTFTVATAMTTGGADSCTALCNGGSWNGGCETGLEGETCQCDMTVASCA